MASVDRDKLTASMNDRLSLEHAKGASEYLLKVKSVRKYQGKWYANVLLDPRGDDTVKVELPWDDKELRHTATLNGFTMEEELYISFMSVLRGIAGYRR